MHAEVRTCMRVCVRERACTCENIRVRVPLRTCVFACAYVNRFACMHVRASRVCVHAVVRACTYA